MANKIQIKRGLKANLPLLDVGEPAFTTDTKEFFIGDGARNIEFAKQSDLEITNSQVLDLSFKLAGGTANAITLSMQTLTDGYSKTFIASANNGGTATTINGKPLYKPNTTTAPNLILGKAYTVWYNSTGDCFFIKASAEGDAIAANVLAGKKFSNDDDTGIVGTMPNNGALNGSLNCGGSFNIPAGYTTGGKVTANSLASQTADATATSADIILNKTAYVNGTKVTGNVTISSLGGRRYTYGSFYHKVDINDNVTLPFTASVIVVDMGGKRYVYTGTGIFVFVSKTPSYFPNLTITGSNINLSGPTAENSVTYQAWE